MIAEELWGCHFHQPEWVLNSRQSVSIVFLKMDVSISLVKNVILLDSEGKRVAVKYFSDDWPGLSAKLAFEKSIFTKTHRTGARSEAEIGLLDGYIVVYKFISDLHFYVTGGEDENEIIVATVLQGFFDAVSLLLRNNVDKKNILENFDLVLLCLDEIVDGGYSTCFCILVLTNIF